MKSNKSNRTASKVRNRQVCKIIKEVASLSLSQPRETKKGIKILDQYLQLLGKTNTDLLRLKGHFLDILGKNQESAIIYRKIISLVPNHIEALCDLGDAHQNLGEFRKSLRYYNRALRFLQKGQGYTGIYRYSVKGEDFIQAMAGKVESLLALKNPTLAIKCLLEALQRYPYDICLVARFQEAQELFQKLESK